MSSDPPSAVVTLNLLRRPPAGTLVGTCRANECIGTVFVALGERADSARDTGEHDPDSSELSPEQRLDPPTTRLINAGLATIKDMETLHACVAYENANQQRVPILRRLEDRASEIRSQDD